MDEKVLAEIKELIDSWDFAFLQSGPLTSAVDENGVVHLQDEQGHSIIMMNEVDYEELVAYKESTTDVCC